MEALNLKLVAGTILAAGAIAVFIPAIQRQVAIYQIQHAFPGLKAQPPKKAFEGYPTVERVNTEFPGVVKVMVSMENKGTEPKDSVGFECMAVDAANKPLALGTGFVTNLGAGQKGYGEAIIVLPQGSKLGRVGCKYDPTWG